ncbi:hypothetical protein F652_2403 [Enterobacteriaceae bacterium bta3-1]|nr:hypothetical protein F652_2403 [Enterobacteriaceae bacterium bta3-1]
MLLKNILQIYIAFYSAFFRENTWGTFEKFILLASKFNNINVIIWLSPRFVQSIKYVLN